MGFLVQGSRFKVSGLGFRVEGLEFGDYCREGARLITRLRACGS